VIVGGSISVFPSGVCELLYPITTILFALSLIIYTLTWPIDQTTIRVDETTNDVVLPLTPGLTVTRINPRLAHFGRKITKPRRADEQVDAQYRLHSLYSLWSYEQQIKDLAVQHILLATRLDNLKNELYSVVGRRPAQLGLHPEHVDPIGRYHHLL
jgi:hypothetical protein